MASHETAAPAHTARHATSGDRLLRGRTVTINRDRNELYTFWRDFRNLPEFMENVRSVECRTDRDSHWVVEGPAGKRLEWDAHITADEPGRLIAWEADENADIRHSGRIEFRDAPPGRGTEVSAIIAYDAPGGRLGAVIAQLFRKEPEVQARHELRRFKQLMETGEIAVTTPGPAAPRPE